MKILFPFILLLSLGASCSTTKQINKKEKLIQKGDELSKLLYNKEIGPIWNSMSSKVKAYFEQTFKKIFFKYSSSHSLVYFTKVQLC